MKPLIALSVVLPLLLSCAVASAAPAEACLPEFRDGWIRLPANAAMPMAAGFGRFSNGCGGALEVRAVSSAAFGDVSLHETTQVGGVSRMREVEALPLPAGGDVVLQPGGLHLMLMQPAQPLHEGERLPLVFGLRDGREIQAELEVRKAAP